MGKRVGRLEDSLLEANTDLATVDASVRALRRQLVETPKTQASKTSGISDQGTNLMRDRLYGLRVALEEARTKYAPAHPRVQELQRQVAAAEEILRLERRSGTQTTTAPNQAFEEATLQLLVQERRLAALQAKSGSLGQQLAEARAELRTLCDNEVRVAKLQREQEILDAKYRRYAAMLEESRLDAALKARHISNISVIQEASLDLRPVRPRKLLSLLVGLVVGILGGIGWALAADYFNRSFVTAEDVEKRLHLRTLALVPRLRPGRSPSAKGTDRMILKTAAETAVPRPPCQWAGVGAERYGLRVLEGLHWPGVDAAAAIRSLGVTSCTSGEGVSAIAMGLARAAASFGDQQVLLVDANPRRPPGGVTRGAAMTAGLLEVLGGSVAPREAVQPTAVPNLATMPSGSANGSADGMYNLGSFPEILGTLKRHFGLIVFDMPAVEAMGSALRLAGLLDGVLLVVEAERVRWETAQRSTGRLVEAGVRLLGAVLNSAADAFPRGSTDHSRRSDPTRIAAGHVCSLVSPRVASALFSRCSRIEHRAVLAVAVSRDGRVRTAARGPQRLLFRPPGAHTLGYGAPRAGRCRVGHGPRWPVAPDRRVRLVGFPLGRRVAAGRG